MEPCRCYVMLEKHTYLLQELMLEGGDVYRAVSPCGSRCSFSLSWSHDLSQISVLFGSVDTGALSQWKALVVKRWIRHFVHPHLFDFR